MRDINRAILVGRLTRDPELRWTQSGLAILSIGVAVNDSRKNPSTGEWEDYPNFLDCVMMGERAEKIEPKLHKGMKVCIDGKLHWSQWERGGQKRSKVEIDIDQIEFMQRREAQADAQPEPQTVSEQYDEDIPF